MINRIAQLEERILRLEETLYNEDGNKFTVNVKTLNDSDSYKKMHVALVICISVNGYNPNKINEVRERFEKELDRRVYFKSVQTTKGYRITFAVGNHLNDTIGILLKRKDEPKKEEAPAKYRVEVTFSDKEHVFLKESLVRYFKENEYSDTAVRNIIAKYAACTRSNLDVILYNLGDKVMVKVTDERLNDTCIVSLYIYLEPKKDVCEVVSALDLPRNTLYADFVVSMAEYIRRNGIDIKQIIEMTNRFRIDNNIAAKFIVQTTHNMQTGDSIIYFRVFREIAPFAQLNVKQL